MKITISNKTVVNGDISRDVRRDIVAKFPLGVESGDGFLSLGRAAADFVIKKFPDAELNDLRSFSPLDFPPVMKFPPKKSKCRLESWVNSSGGFIFLIKNSFRRGVPNFIRNICSVAQSKCCVVTNQQKMLIENCKSLFPDDYATYMDVGNTQYSIINNQCQSEEPHNSHYSHSENSPNTNYGVIFYILDSPADLHLLDNLPAVKNIFVIAPPSPEMYSVAENMKCSIGNVLYNNSRSSIIDYYPVATPFVDVDRYSVNDDRRLNMNSTVFNMLENFHRNEILINMINNTRADKNLFLTKFISHVNNLIKPLEYLNPIVMLNRDFCSVKEYEAAKKRLADPQDELTGLNVFMSYDEAIQLEMEGSLIADFDNCYFLTPVASAVAMKATKSFRKSREKNLSPKKIYDFTDLRVRELSKQAKTRRELFGKSEWVKLHSMIKKYVN